MKICLDTSASVHRRAGLGRVAHELVTALLQVAPEHEYSVFYNASATAHIDPPLDRLPHLAIPLPDKRWRLSVLMAHLLHRPQDRLIGRVDIFHATDHVLPNLRHVRTVFNLGDLTFLSHAHTHSVLNRTYLRLMLPRFLQKSDAVIAISACTLREMEIRYGAMAARSKVIYPGVSDHFRPVAGEMGLTQVRERYQLPRHFLLFVGTIEPRKNLNRLLEAYQALKSLRSDFKLVIAGRKGWLYDSFFSRLHELGLENEVVLPGFIPDEDLPALYSAADLFVFPSLWEGFGLPPLEAMACGCPVVCSNASSLPEVVGDAAVLFDPHDTDALAHALTRVLDDPLLRAELRARGLARARRFSWKRTARETLAVYEQVIAEC